MCEEMAEFLDGLRLIRPMVIQEFIEASGYMSDECDIRFAVFHFILSNKYVIHHAPTITKVKPR